MQCLEVFCKSCFHIVKRVLKSAEKNGISCSRRVIFTEFFGSLGVFELFTLRVLSGVVGLTAELVAGRLELVLAMTGVLSGVVRLMAELVAGRLELVLAMGGVLSVVVGLTAELVASRRLELVLALGAMELFLRWILPFAPPSATASR